MVAQRGMIANLISQSVQMESSMSGRGPGPLNAITKAVAPDREIVKLTAALADVRHRQQAQEDGGHIRREHWR